MRQPKVSIFMPTFNQENFVSSALDSVLSQDFDDYEIVIGDDCSSDGTWKIIEDYKKKYPDKIISFRNERNLGITANCNEILKRCRGEYVAFFAGDDLFLPGKLTKQVIEMDVDANIVMCYHDIEVFDSETGRHIRYWNRGPGSRPAVYGLASEVLPKVVSQGTSFLSAQSVMVRRSAIPQEGYDPRVPFASDWLMWIDILANANEKARVVFLPEVLARYRRHAANITNRVDAYYRADPLITLAIVESKYPLLVPYVERARARLHYACAIRYILNGESKLGRFFLFLSIRKGWWSWKCIVWLWISYFPRFRAVIRGRAV